VIVASSKVRYGAAMRELMRRGATRRGKNIFKEKGALAAPKFLLELHCCLIDRDIHDLRVEGQAISIGFTRETPEECSCRRHLESIPSAKRASSRIFGTTTLEREVEKLADVQYRNLLSQSFEVRLVGEAHFPLPWF
jgi:hypothetical protein